MYLRRPLATLTAIALTAVAFTGTGCGRRYDVTVRFKGDAADRRLARGESDTIKGRLERSDGQNVFIKRDGMSEPIAIADIDTVDQTMAKRDVRIGTISIIAGVVIAGVSMYYFDCDGDDFPVFCAFSSENNFLAGLGFLGGVVLVGGGLGAVVSGKADQSRNADLLRTSGVRTSALSAAWRF